MRKRFDNRSHGMAAAQKVFSLFPIALATAMAVCCCCCALAEMQPDLVGPPGQFEEAVAELMAQDKDVTLDVAEMLVAADQLQRTADGRDAETSDAESKSKLRAALELEDELQREAAELYDRLYDYFLDLYPKWRMYVLCKNPALRERLYAEYLELLGRYERDRGDLIADLGVLLNLETALLPSNAYVDPNGRIRPSVDTAAVLEKFDPDDADD